MEPIRLWRAPVEHGESVWWFDPPESNGTEYAALPRADYDALVRERDEERHWKCFHARSAEAAAERVVELWKRVKEAESQRDEAVRAEAVERHNHQGDLDYIAKATGAAYSTTEAQPERAVEIRHAVESIIKQRDEAVARAEKAEEALRWYAEEYNYHPWDGRDGAKDGIPALEDRGAKAREALGGPRA